MSQSHPPIIKTYAGHEKEALKKSEEDQRRLARRGYHAVSRSYSTGSWGGGAFWVAFLFSLVGIGLPFLIYMLIVKPPGSLTVTYEYQAPFEAEKTCPRCAEDVKRAALVCRFCGHEFDPEEVPTEEFYYGPPSLY